MAVHLTHRTTQAPGHTALKWHRQRSHSGIHDSNACTFSNLALKREIEYGMANSQLCEVGSGVGPPTPLWVVVGGARIKERMARACCLIRYG